MTMPATPVLGESEDPRGDLAWGTIPNLVEWAATCFADS